MHCPIFKTQCKLSLSASLIVCMEIDLFSFQNGCAQLTLELTLSSSFYVYLIYPPLTPISRKTVPNLSSQPTRGNVSVSTLFLWLPGARCTPSPPSPASPELQLRWMSSSVAETLEELSRGPKGADSSPLSLTLLRSVQAKPLVSC